MVVVTPRNYRLGELSKGCGKAETAGNEQIKPGSFSGGFKELLDVEEVELLNLIVS